MGGHFLVAFVLAKCVDLSVELLVRFPSEGNGIYGFLFRCLVFVILWLYFGYVCVALMGHVAASGPEAADSRHSHSLAQGYDSTTTFVDLQPKREISKHARSISKSRAVFLCH